MSLYDCLKEAEKAKLISSDDVETLFGEYERLKARQAGGVAGAADKEAKRQLEQMLVQKATRAKQLAFLAAKNIAEIEVKLDSYRTAKGEADVGDAAVRLLEHFGDAPYSSVAGRQTALLGMAHAKMGALLEEFRRSGILGDNLSVGNLRLSFRKNQARLENVVKEAFDQDSGDAAAKALFEAWQETSEFLRMRFNAAGGQISKIEYGWMPQTHDAKALLNAGRAKWKKSIRPLLDISRMRHPVSGHAVKPGEMDEILDAVYDSITTHGWSKKDPKRAKSGRGALANQYRDERFLEFKDAQSWTKYQNDFGNGDPFAAMMQHINAMTRDIASLEILGPNPLGTLEYIKQRVRKEASEKATGKNGARIRKSDKNAVDHAENIARRLDDVYASLRGELETPVDNKWADVLAGARNFVTASVLGSASLSALSDLGFQHITRKFVGLPTTSLLTDTLRQFKKSDKFDAVRAGLILDAANHTVHRQARYVGSMTGPEWTSYLADRVLTWSLLSPWTQAGRHSFGMSMMGELANQSKNGFDALPTPFKKLFERWNISPNDWNQIRKTSPYEPQKGATFIRPSDMADQDLAEKVLEMILMETEYAVPSNTHRGRSTFIRDRPGTLQGEFWRSAFQFKSFAATLHVLHIGRLINEAQKSPARGAKYAASLFLTTTILGAASLQFKQVAAGRDPRNMKSSDFWMQAMMQGGGLGIYGDFLISDLNRYGGGLPMTITGPLVARGNDLLNLTVGNGMQALTGEETNAGRELVNFLKGNTPGSTIWYWRLIYERQIMDTMQEMIDPKAKESFKRKKQWWAREAGQEFYWAPGEKSPERGPDLSAAWQ
jgi:hypothetical protein